jgi:hypothetical protein
LRATRAFSWCTTTGKGFCWARSTRPPLKEY